MRCCGCCGNALKVRNTGDVKHEEICKRLGKKCLRNTTQLECCLLDAEVVPKGFKVGLRRCAA